MEEKSKSELKREMTSLQELGRRLVELPGQQTDTIEMPEELREAIFLARTLNSHSARRRQLQYIGALMRRIDTAPVREALMDMEKGQKNKVRKFHQVELMRDRLIEGDDAFLEEISGRFPDADLQRLRQFIRGARKEKKENKPPKQSRALFRYLKELSVGN